MGVSETVESLVGVRFLAVVDKSHGCLLSMCVETCTWGFEVTVRPHAGARGCSGQEAVS